MQRNTRDMDHLERLDQLCRKANRSARKLSDEELDELPRLYRGAASIASRLATRGDSPAQIQESKRVLQAAHAQLHSGLRDDRRPWYVRALRFAFIEGAQAIRLEWKVVVGWNVLLYALGLIGFWLAADDMHLAFQLADPGDVSIAIDQLDGLEEGEAWEGNFTFAFEDSSAPAGFIMGNNLGVTILWMVMGIFPPLLFWRIATFALMIGAYIGVAHHWGQSASIFSILMCHGTLELTAAMLASTAGTIFARALVFPGGFSRSHAMRVAAPHAMRVFAPTVPMLVAAGLIEGYVSPHAATNVRLTIALLSAILILAWFGFVGRDARPAPVSSTAPAPRS